MHALKTIWLFALFMAVSTAFGKSVALLLVYLVDWWTLGVRFEMVQMFVCILVATLCGAAQVIQWIACHAMSSTAAKKAKTDAELRQEIKEELRVEMLAKAFGQAAAEREVERTHKN